MKKSLVAFILLTINSTAWGSTSLEVRTEYESWNSGLGGKATGLLFGAGANYRINESWNLSAGFVTGNPSIDSTDKTTVSRSDIDMGAVYSIQQKYFLFGGYRLVKLSYNNDSEPTRSFDDLMHGMGIGAGLLQTIEPQLHAFGRASVSILQSTIDYHTEPTNNGDGYSIGMEGGLLYLLNVKSSLVFSIKRQTNSLTYKNDNTWHNNYLRFGLSINYSF